jgi:hypothetical protein
MPFITSLVTQGRSSPYINEYGRDGEVLGLVVGHSGEASSDAYHIEDLEATRLASKHLDYIKTLASIAKAMQRNCRSGTLLCTWIRAGHLGSRAGQPVSSARLS